MTGYYNVILAGVLLIKPINVFYIKVLGVIGWLSKMII